MTYEKNVCDSVYHTCVKTWVKELADFFENIVNCFLVKIKNCYVTLMACCVIVFHDRFISMEYEGVKPIVLYYSRSGHTEKLAQLIATDMHGEIIRITPEKEYRGSRATFSRVMKDRLKKKHRQAVTPVPDLKGFDPVFIGFPIWAKDMPDFVADFISKCDLKGKTVIPFATFGFSGIRGAEKTLERVCEGARIVMPFEDGTFRGGDYRKWRHDVRMMIWNME